MRSTLLLGLCLVIPSLAAIAQTTPITPDQIPTTQGTAATRPVSGLKPRANGPDTYDQDYTEDNAMIANRKRQLASQQRIDLMKGQIEDLIEAERERVEKTPEYVEARRISDWYAALDRSERAAARDRLHAQPAYKAAREAQKAAQVELYAAAQKGWSAEQQTGLNNKLAAAEADLARLDKEAMEADPVLPRIAEKLDPALAAAQKLEDDDIAAYRKTPAMERRRIQLEQEQNRAVFYESEAKRLALKQSQRPDPAPAAPPSAAAAPAAAPAPANPKLTGRAALFGNR
jgi:hypothetical protein